MTIDNIENIKKRIIEKKDGDWSAYEPECEIQKGDNGDWRDCSFEACINDISIILQKKYGIKENWSQRFSAAILSQGGIREGFTLFDAVQSITENGLVVEKTWPRNRTLTKEDYYKTPSEEAIKEGKEWLSKYKIKCYYIPTDIRSLDEFQELAPPVVSGPAWDMVDGVYVSNTGRRAKHAFVRVKKADINTGLNIIFDSYPSDMAIDDSSSKEEFTKILSSDYVFGEAIIFIINLRPKYEIWLYKLMQTIKEFVTQIKNQIITFLKSEKGQRFLYEVKSFLVTFLSTLFIFLLADQSFKTFVDTGLFDLTLFQVIKNAVIISFGRTIAIYVSKSLGIDYRQLTQSYK